LKRVNSFPTLTRSGELELWQAWKQTGNSAAYEQLINANLRHVATIALKYRRYSIPIGDLISEGNFGLIHAARKFEPERGLRFFTYAVYWVRAYILNHVIQSWSLVGAGSGPLRSRLFFKLRRERARIYGLVGEGDEGSEIIAKRLNLPVERIAEFEQRLVHRDYSLNCETSRGRETCFIETLVYPQGNQEERYSNLESEVFIRDVVQRAIGTLDRRERFVIEASVMNDTEKGQSLAEIGRKLGISRERSRQLGVRAKKKLKRYITQCLVDSDSNVELSGFSR
jgi:RNA polymerase sigma-32 factor